MRFPNDLKERMKCFNEKCQNKFFYFACILTGIGLFYTINADIFLQNSSPLLLPIQSVFSSNEYTIEFNDLVKNEKKTAIQDSISNDKTYIFTLDVSASIVNSGTTPIWYKNTVDEINNIMGTRRDGFASSSRPSGFELCKVKLAQLLLEINDTRSLFTIWTVGNFGERIFPREDHCVVASSRNILIALQILKEYKGSQNEMNTNFTNLFEMLLSNYKLNKEISDRYLDKSYVLVLISDMIHSIHKKFPNLSRNELFEEINSDRITLYEKIDKIRKCNLLTNVIVISDALNKNKINDWETDILSKFEEFEHFYFDKISIRDKMVQMLYTKIQIRDELIFYYTNEKYSVSKCQLIISHYGKYKFELSYRPNSYANAFTCEYEVLDASAKPLQGDGKKDFLTYGNYTPTIELQENNIVQFNYEGRIYSQNDNLELTIFSPKDVDRKAYIVPISFIKRLSLSTSLFMIIIQLIALFILISLVSDFYKSIKDIKKSASVGKDAQA